MADECVRQMDGLKLENLAITVEIARRCDLGRGDASVSVSVRAGVWLLGTPFALRRVLSRRADKALLWC